MLQSFSSVIGSEEGSAARASLIASITPGDLNLVLKSERDTIIHGNYQAIVDPLLKGSLKVLRNMKIDWNNEKTLKILFIICRISTLKINKVLVTDFTEVCSNIVKKG